MKSRIIIALAVILSGYTSCKKCATCTPYYTNGTKAGSMQVVTECTKRDINAYNNGHYVDTNDSTIIFKCI